MREIAAHSRARACEEIAAHFRVRWDERRKGKRHRHRSFPRTRAVRESCRPCAIPSHARRLAYASPVNAKASTAAWSESSWRRCGHARPCPLAFPSSSRIRRREPSSNPIVFAAPMHFSRWWHAPGGVPPTWQRNRALSGRPAAPALRIADIAAAGRNRPSAASR